MTVRRSKIPPVVAGLVLAAIVLAVPTVAQAQNACNGYRCASTLCWMAGNPPVQNCVLIRSGCYGAAPNPGSCMCPLSGGTTCTKELSARPGEAPTPSELAFEATEVCHELVRQRLGVDRGIRLFDSGAVSADVLDTGRVKVAGKAYPGGVPASDDGDSDDAFALPEERAGGLAFTCEVKRSEKGSWSPVILELPEVR